ncbi:MAG: ATP-dependent RecD-like DNA helicase [Anaerolineales bacterium]|nr:ATP-dependent RecD-like DNA helicase [Anaerolineales bacterium]
MTDTLSGTVDRITYFNQENGYTVLQLAPDQAMVPGLSKGGLATVVGSLPEVAPGEHLALEGRWTTHSKYGTQFAVEVCKPSVPVTPDGLKRYLGSGLIEGIGPQFAERIADHFGEDTLQVLEDQPERLTEIPGIGPKRSRGIQRAWEEQRGVKEIMLFLHEHGISTNLAVKIYKTYGEEALTMVRGNPYQLERDIYGVGFKTADRIARDLGLPTDHPSRIEAGIIYALEEDLGEGHTYSPPGSLLDRAVELLDCSPALIEEGLARLIKEDRIRVDRVPLPGDTPDGEVSPEQIDAVYLTPFYHAETGAASLLRELAGALPSRLSDIPPAFLEELHPPGEDAVALSDDQKAAAHTALTHPVSVLTGGPGTGKTTCLRYLISILEGSSKRIALASPTGRAAKHLSTATGQPASTVHRLLGYSPQEGFQHDREDPLEIDILIVDEASMLDLPLTYNLLKALAPGTHLLLVGDVDQLPSVGPGNVLGDVIASGAAPVTRLQSIFRQAAGSEIITNAHRINRGEMPVFPVRDPGAERQPDFYLFPAEDAAAAADWIVDLVTRRIPEQFGLDPREDIQVLAPMYRGPAGVDALNDRLQAALNPARKGFPEKALFGNTYRPGDKVMQLENDYTKEVFNGDIGTLREIEETGQILTVEFDGRLVKYEWSEADTLTLAYAVSVHKAQGAEFPAVVLPAVTQHYIMLRRNLLYTAVTRAQRLCVLAGNRRAVAIAVNNHQEAQRCSALDWRLKSS